MTGIQSAAYWTAPSLVNPIYRIHVFHLTRKKTAFGLLLTAIGFPLLVTGLYSLEMYDRLYDSAKHRLEVSPDAMVACGNGLFGCFRPLELPQFDMIIIAEIAIGAPFAVLGALIAIKTALPYEPKPSQIAGEPITGGAPFK